MPGEKGFDRVGDARKGPPQSYGSPLRVAFLTLVLHAGGGDSLDEVLLGGEEDHYRGQDRDDRHGHDPVPVEIGGNVHRHPQPEGDRVFGDAGDVDQHVEEVVPPPDELEDDDREDHAGAQGKQDPGQDQEAAASVQFRGFIQLQRQPAEELDGHVVEEGVGGESCRDDEGQIAVQPAELPEKDIAGDDDDRAWQHHRAEHQHEEQFLEWEAEAGEAVADQHAAGHREQDGRNDHQEGVHQEASEGILPGTPPAVCPGVVDRLFGQQADRAENLGVGLEGRPDHPQQGIDHDVGEQYQDQVRNERAGFAAFSHTLSP